MIREYLRTFAKAAVAIFCVWHMAAVGVFSLPTDAKDNVTRWIRESAAPHIRPYVLVTSQWQQWNLFAPNPLRRIVFYRIEKQNLAGEWAYVDSINHTSYSPWRHSVRFKLYSQALEEHTTRPELTERAAQVLCDEYGIDDGTNVRLWHELTIVPYVRPSPGTSWWNTWIPQFESTLAIDTACKP